MTRRILRPLEIGVDFQNHLFDDRKESLPGAHRLNLAVQSEALGDNVAGMLVIEGDRGAIGYNSTHALVRQRFTIAHEISHYLLDTKKNQKSQLWTVAGVWAAMWTFEPKLPDCRFITPTSLWNIVIVKSSGLGTDA